MGPKRSPQVNGQVIASMTKNAPNEKECIGTCFACDPKCPVHEQKRRQREAAQAPPIKPRRAKRRATPSRPVAPDE
jgi:hypothetical protein